MAISRSVLICLATAFVAFQCPSVQALACNSTSNKLFKDCSNPCQSYNDGCNNCNCHEGGSICTEMACSVYSLPKCKDPDTTCVGVLDPDAGDFSLAHPNVWLAGALFSTLATIFVGWPRHEGLRPASLFSRSFTELYCRVYSTCLFMLVIPYVCVKTKLSSRRQNYS